MDGRVLCTILGVFLFIVIIYLVFSGGDDDADAAPKVIIPPKDNICRQTEKSFNKSYLVPNNLNQLRINDDYTDIELRTSSNGTVIRAHKVILASHSQYFDTNIWILKSDQPYRMQQLDIEFIEYKTLMIVLNFMYSASLSDDIFRNASDYESLMRAATTFQMDSLKCEISKRLNPRLNIHNAGSLVALATETNASFLMIVAANFLLDRYQEVSLTKEWHAVIQTHKNILAKAIDFHGQIAENTVCDIECVPATLQSLAIFTRLRQFFLTERFADAEIFVAGNDSGGGAGKVFRVNRATLIGQSAAFRLAFGDGQRIQLNGIDVNVMEEFLVYMYSGWPTQKMEKMPAGLLYLSALYGMHGLQTACEQILIGQLNIQNAAEIIVIADNAKSEHLRTVTLEFILKNIRDVVKTSAWINLRDNHPEMLTKIHPL